MEQKKRGRKPKTVESIPDAEPTSRPPTIHFTGCGWCEELNRSYFSGYFQPETWAEFNALKEYGEVCE